MGIYTWYCCILHQVKLMKDVTTARGEMLPVDQRRKLGEADANVSRAQLPLRCKVWLRCHCCTMELHMSLCFMPLQRKAR